MVMVMMTMACRHIPTACVRCYIITMVALFSSVFFSCVSSNYLPEMMHSHTGCICLTFLQCVFSCVSSNYLPEMMHSHTGCICWTFLQCVFSCVSSNDLHEMMHSYTGRICRAFLRCVLACASSNDLPEMMHSYNDCICLTACIFHSLFQFENTHENTHWRKVKQMQPV